MSYGWFFVRWLHLLAVAFFVGGQMMLAAVVVPVARHPSDREALRRIARRFGQGTLVALSVLVATGAPSSPPTSNQWVVGQFGFCLQTS